MLKKIIKRINFRKKSVELNLTSDEQIRDKIISAAMKAAEEAVYAAGNPTEKMNWNCKWSR